LKQFLNIFWIFLSQSLTAQSNIYVLDITNQLPPAGVSVIIFNYPNVHFTDLEGKVTIP